MPSLLQYLGPGGMLGPGTKPTVTIVAAAGIGDKSMYEKQITYITRLLNLLVPPANPQDPVRTGRYMATTSEQSEDRNDPDGKVVVQFDPEAMSYTKYPDLKTKLWKSQYRVWLEEKLIVPNTEFNSWEKQYASKVDEKYWPKQAESSAEETKAYHERRLGYPVDL